MFDGYNFTAALIAFGYCIGFSFGVITCLAQDIRDHIRSRKKNE